MNAKWDSTLTVILVVCAMITTGLVAHREFVASSSASVLSAANKPTLVQDWRAHLGQGVTLGPPAAPVSFIEFADFECPFCGDIHKKLKLLRERYPTQVSLTFVHFPLPGHRFALPAARVAECAGAQGRFEAMYDRLFDEQDSFGLKPWSEYAAAAGVPNIADFDACMKKNDPIARIEVGRALGAKLNVQGTPTLIVNGWMLRHPPSQEELEAMVKDVLAGKNLFSNADKS